MDSRLPDRFWDKVEPCPMSGCWTWIGAVNHNGYGSFFWQGKTELAHRLSYRILVSELSAEEICDHLCRNRACVNPKHIEPVSHAENVRRGESGKDLAERTHCKNGHHFSGANLRIRSDGVRICRECHRQWARKYRRMRSAVSMAAITIVGVFR